MARSLKGATFYTCRNNGVTALVDAATLADINRLRAIHTLLGTSAEVLPLMLVPCGPRFTFTRKERADRSPWITGSESDLTPLFDHLRAVGAEVRDELFHVPFSNGTELGLHGVDAQRWELALVTTTQQFIDTFGVSLEELRSKIW